METSFVTALLIAASIIDVFLAGLLLIASGFVFDAGPEGMGGAPPIVAVWAILLISSMAVPILGFVLRRLGNAGAGALIALLPPIAALIAAARGVYLW